MPPPPVLPVGTDDGAAPVLWTVTVINAAEEICKSETSTKPGYGRVSKTCLFTILANRGRLQHLHIQNIYTSWSVNG